MSTRVPDRNLDSRTVRRNIRSGRLNQTDFDAYLEELPDLAAKVMGKDEGGDDDGFDEHYLGKPNPSALRRAFAAVERVHEPGDEADYNDEEDDDDDDLDDDDLDDDDDDDDDDVEDGGDAKREPEIQAKPEIDTAGADDLFAAPAPRPAYAQPVTPYIVPTPAAPAPPSAVPPSATPTLPPFDPSPQGNPGEESNDTKPFDPTGDDDPDALV